MVWERIVSSLFIDHSDALGEMRTDRAQHDGTQFIFPQALIDNKRKGPRSREEEKEDEQTKRRKEEGRRIENGDDARAAVDAALLFFFHGRV